MGFIIERETCIGCGICATLYPELFVMDGEQKAEVQDIPMVDEDRARDAQSTCPVNAILEK